MTTSSHKVTIDASKDKIFKAITTEQSEENCRARSCNYTSVAFVV